MGTRDRRSMRIHRIATGRKLVQRAGKIAAMMEAPAPRMVSGAERARLIELLMKVAGGRALQRCAAR